MWGTPVGDAVRLADGTTVAADEVRHLPPVEPCKIVATHLTYRSRAEEYRMARLPAEPSYFLKPPSSVSAHRAPVPVRGGAPSSTTRGRSRSSSGSAVSARP